MSFAFSRPTPAALRPAAPQPAAERGSAPSRREDAVVQAACHRCARLGAPKFPWPASFWEPRGPEGKKDPIERYARRLAAQAISASQEAAREPSPLCAVSRTSFSVRENCRWLRGLDLFKNVLGGNCGSRPEDWLREPATTENCFCRQFPSETERSRKPLCGYPYRGFESHPLRHSILSLLAYFEEVDFAPRPKPVSSPLSFF
jgi:hypothetical protein